jgi:hypothetical protein
MKKIIKYILAINIIIYIIFNIVQLNAENIENNSSLNIVKERC